VTAYSSVSLSPHGLAAVSQPQESQGEAIPVHPKRAHPKGKQDAGFCLSSEAGCQAPASPAVPRDQFVWQQVPSQQRRGDSRANSQKRGVARARQGPGLEPGGMRFRARDKKAPRAKALCSAWAEQRE
jgi:hypothetical protein